MAELTIDKNGDVDVRLLRRLTGLRRWLGWMLVLGVGLYALPLLLGTPENLWVPISLTGFGLLFATMLLTFPLGAAKCPRCKRPFYMSKGAWTFWVKYNPFQKRCTHCEWSIRGDGANNEKRGTNTPSP